MTNMIFVIAKKEKNGSFPSMSNCLDGRFYTKYQDAMFARDKVNVQQGENYEIFSVIAMVQQVVDFEPPF